MEHGRGGRAAGGKAPLQERDLFLHTVGQLPH